MEKASGLELDWYREYWVNTTHMIDYGINDVIDNEEGKAVLSLQKIGVMPMPLDVVVEMKDGSKKMYNIALRIMRGNKNFEGEIAEDWPWTHPSYNLQLDVAKEQIAKISIDPSIKMMDVERSNNEWQNR